MADDTRGDESLLGPFKEFLDSLAGGATPSSLLSPDLMGQVLEIQRAVLRQTLGRNPGNGEATGPEREAMKALMLCSLEVMQSTRDYRESVIKSQSALIARCVELLGEVLMKPEAPTAGKPGDDEAKSEKSTSAQPKAKPPGG